MPDLIDVDELIHAPANQEISVGRIVNAGARFVVAVAGDIMRMPGLPKEPAAMGMDVKDGIITGLS